MNMAQKTVLGVGAILTALRLVFPVEDKTISGIRFSMKEGMFQQADWTTTAIHAAGIIVVAGVAVFILNKR